MIGLKQKLDRMISSVKDEKKNSMCAQHIHIDNSDDSLAPSDHDDKS